MDRKRFLALIIIIVWAGACGAAYAEDERPRKDDFFSSALSDIFGKVNQYTSGEKSIISNEDTSTLGDVGYAAETTSQRVARSTPRPAKGPSE